MVVEASQVKELRERTGAGILDCRSALTEMDGSIDKAMVWLREKGLAQAQKKAGRETKDGLIYAYIHQGGKLGVLVEVNCEDDFVARTEEFQGLVKDIAMHIAASHPHYLKREDVPEEVIEHEKSIYEAQARDSGKPSTVWEKISKGRLEKFYSEVCLLEQPFIRNPDIRIKEMVDQKIASVGENIAIQRFTRYQIGADE